MDTLQITFQNQVAIITGATRGIGRTTAELMAHSGASLILTGTSDKSVQNLKEHFLTNNIPGNHSFLVVDFSREQSTKEFIQSLERFERIDVCINNAGINIIKPLEEVSSQEYGRLMDINLTAPYLISQVVTRKMKHHGYGRIVNISSIWGVISKANRSLYTTSKHALIGLTKTTAIECAEKNVYCNCVSPGFTLTELTRQSLSADEMLQLENQIPAKKMASTEDIAKTILFMSSNLNQYITGQNIVIDGGFTII